MREDTVPGGIPIFNGTRSAPSIAFTRSAALKFLSAEERRALSRVSLLSRPVRASEELVREGELIGSIQFLIDGWACRFKLTRDGRRQISTLLAPGDVCNLDALLFDRLDYGVRMLTAGTILSIPRERVIALAAEYPGISRGFTWLGFVENAILAQWALCLGRQSARERVAHLICELAVRLGCSDDDGEISFELPLTQEHLADALGLTPVHVNRTLGQLRAEGMLASSVRRFEVRDVAALRRIADFSPTYLHIDDAEIASASSPDRFILTQAVRHVSADPR